jgi:calcineurin-like phosphoesterase family protein
LGQIYFTSDEHYGHANVIKFCNRPFSSVEEMNEGLVERHNQRVRQGDLVYHLGDMFWRKLGVEKAREIINRLNGQHYYVWGNHEELMESNADLRNRFVWCKDIARVFPSKGTDYPKIVLCHYAMRTWRGSHRGDWHLYGHTHAGIPEYGLSFDVGVDARNFFPVSVDEVADIMRRKKAADEVVNETIGCCQGE